MKKIVVLLLAVVLCSCRKADRPATVLVEPPANQKQEPWRASFDRGAAFLLSKQSEDGAWRSETYGHFKHGDALTPLAIVALQRAPETPEINAAIDRGIRWLMRFVIIRKGPKGAHAIDGELQYPVYTASLTIIALSDPRQKKYLKIRDAWVKFLLAHQFTADNGWSERDWQFGGWGYSGVVPKKPRVSLPPAALEANLSATAYALSALRNAGLHHHDNAFEQAVSFVSRCRNDDGGFFFAPGDAFRNKAGMDSKPGEKPRFRSYGSTTADGLRCLQALGGWGTDRMLDAANKWLENRFTPTTGFFHHGDFMPDREKDRDAAFYYYAAALSERIGGGTQHDKIVEAVIARQHADGSSQNALNTVREDDPIVATALAMMALRWMPRIE